MKPTSIILFILSLILIAFGLGLCNISEKKAQTDGFDLFIQSNDENGNLITTFDIDETTITKIALNLNDVNVYVSSDSASSRIELVNYPINTFTYLSANGVLTIDDNVNLLTLFNITGQGVQFHGLRHYLNPANFVAKQKSVNVYLSSNAELQELEISALRSSITVDNCDSCLAYSLSTDNGNITVANVSGAETADIIISSEGNANVQWSSVESINIEVAKGSCSYVAQQSNIQSYNANAVSGTVYVDGNDCGSTYSASSAMTLINCRFTVQEGNIIISELA